MSLPLKTRGLGTALLLFLISPLMAQPPGSTPPPTSGAILQQNVLLSPNDLQPLLTDEQLKRLQNQLDQLPPPTAAPHQQYQMLVKRLNILNTLAVNARLNQHPKEQARWQQALRTNAQKLRASTITVQQITGEYWTLLCDLSDIAQHTPNMDSTQRACIQRLKQFLEKHTRVAESSQPQALALIQQVRLGLLELYDQRGNSSQVCKLISQLKQQDPQNKSLHTYLKQTYGYCHLIGTKFNLRLITTDGRTWDSREKRGQPIVLYFWPGPLNFRASNGSDATTTLTNPKPSSDPLWDRMLELQDKAEVLLVDRSHAHASGLQIPPSPWPQYRQEPGQFKLTDYFHVQTLPRVVIIDQNGMIQAIGGPGIGNLLNALSIGLTQRQ